MRRPRVLVLVTLAEVGGAQTYVMSLLPALTERYDVTVAAWGPGPLVESARAAGAEYVALRHVRRELSPVHDPLGVMELVRLMRRIRPDLVHANSSKAGVLGRLAAAIARVPVRVFTVHGWAFKATHGPASAAYLWADRLMRPLTTATICVSETERSAGIAASTCGDDAVVIANAVDVASADQAPLDGDPPHVLSAGRLKEPKDFVTLARALQLVDVPFTAAIAGDGPDRAAVEAALAGRAVVLGERSDVPALLAAADVFVLSSTSEGMPMTVIEAMAAGLPVVASDVGGMRELVEHGVTGLLVPARDADALAGALADLLADPARRRAMGAAGHARAEALFDLPRFRAEHVALYERLLAPNRMRR